MPGDRAWLERAAARKPEDLIVRIGLANLAKHEGDIAAAKRALRLLPETGSVVLHARAANLAGIPGIAFPVGHDSKNLPIGMQLLGQHFQEQILVEVTHAYQQHTSWHQHKPNLKW